jgi:hypothetical protein
VFNGNCSGGLAGRAAPTEQKLGFIGSEGFDLSIN